MGCVYVFKVLNGAYDNLYKLGKTKDLQKRLNTYNTSLADDLEVIFVYTTDNVDELEECVKMKMKNYQYRKYKEIYKVNIDIVKEIIDKCDKFNLSFKGGKDKEIRNENIFMAIYKI